MAKLRAWKSFSVVMALVLVLGLVAMAVPPGSAQADDPVVIFPDANLEAAVREALHKPEGDIHASELASLTSLVASERGIENLSGLEYCINLTWLNMGYNQISDISPLAGFTKLTSLSLRFNQISNISPLACLTNLTFLSLSNNQISNISPLAGLTNLTWLNMGFNQISDISPLAGLTKLTWLNAWTNQISDISPLAGLTKLTSLYLMDNQISNISPLAGLTKLDWLDLSCNQISNISPLAGLTNLTLLDLSTNQISDISPLAGLTNLTTLLLRFNQISDLTPLAGLTKLTLLHLIDNQISDISPLVANPGLAAGDLVNLRDNPLSPTSVHVHIPALQDRGVTVLWDTAAQAVSTSAATNITATSATLNGNLSDLGTAGSVGVSFQWGTTPGSYSAKTDAQVMYSPGNFSHNLSGLRPQTTYYFRAAATSSITTVYGEELSFTTLALPPPPPPQPESLPTLSRPSPTPPRLAPPALSLQYLSINPKQASINQPVTITTNVVNTGGEAGDYTAVLKINGRVEQSRMVSVGPQGTQPVKFTVTKSQPGIYAVYVGGQQANFTILGAGSTASTPVNVGLIAILIVGILVIIVSVLLILDFRRRA